VIDVPDLRRKHGIGRSWCSVEQWIDHVLVRQIS
jgi:hypothetical protein